MTQREIIALCLMSVIVVGCSTNDEISIRDKANLDSTSSLNSEMKDASITQSQLIMDHKPSLGSLHSRKLIIRMEAGGKFSILEIDGSPIALSLSKTEFQREFPQLYKEFDTAIAGIKTGKAFLDL